MLDRSVQFPQRYQLKKVEGTEDIFDFIPAPGEVSAEGTLINKATLWKDATAALFGLGVDSVPDDGFAYLGKYAQHWWKRTSIEGKTKLTSLGSDASIFSVGDQNNRNVRFSDSVNVNLETGKAVLSGSVQSVELYWDSQANIKYIIDRLKGFVGKYLVPWLSNKESDYVYYIDPSATESDFYTVNTASGSDNLQIHVKNSKLYRVDAELVPTVSYVQSSDRSAYPDSGTQDGYEYEYLGIPFDNAVGAPGIESGSYTGTGTYGSDNPNALTFGFSPKVVIIYNNPTVLSIFPEPIAGSHNFYGFKYSGGWSQTIAYIVSYGKTVSWYGQSSMHQLNELGAVYKYIAIG